MRHLAGPIKSATMGTLIVAIVVFGLTDAYAKPSPSPRPSAQPTPSASLAAPPPATSAAPPPATGAAPQPSPSAVAPPASAFPVPVQSTTPQATPSGSNVPSLPSANPSSLPEPSAGPVVAPPAVEQPPVVEQPPAPKPPSKIRKTVTHNDSGWGPDAAAPPEADPLASLRAEVPTELPPTVLTQLRDLYQRTQYLNDTMARTKSDLDTTHVRISSMQAAMASKGVTALDQLVALESAAAILQMTLDSGTAELTKATTEAETLSASAAAWINKVVADRQAAQAASSSAQKQIEYRGGKLLKPVEAGLTSEFGNRYDPYYHRWQLHAGLDLGAGYGTEILAAASGVVTTASWSGGYGNYTCIDHGTVKDSELSTCYGHQSKLLVNAGDRISAGQVIGLVGSTGASTGPHLHFEVRRDGEPVDPAPWL